MVQDYVSIVQTAELNCQLVRTIATEKANSHCLKKRPWKLSQNHCFKKEEMPENSLLQTSVCVEGRGMAGAGGAQLLRRVWLFATPQTSPPGSSVHGCSWKEYWSRLPFPSPGELPDPVMELVYLTSPALAGRFFTTAPPKKPTEICRVIKSHEAKIRKHLV